MRVFMRVFARVQCCASAERRDDEQDAERLYDLTDGLGHVGMGVIKWRL